MSTPNERLTAAVEAAEQAFKQAHVDARNALRAAHERAVQVRDTALAEAEKAFREAVGDTVER